MKCPKCGEPMRAFYVDDEVIYHCSKCGHQEVVLLKGKKK